MRAVAERLATFVGGLTTVPERRARVLPAPPKPPSQTTFGDSAASRSSATIGAPRAAPAVVALVPAVVVGLGGRRDHRATRAPRRPPRTKIAAAWTNSAAPSMPAGNGNRQPVRRRTATTTRTCTRTTAAKKEGAAGKHAAGHRVLASASPADATPASTGSRRRPRPPAPVPATASSDPPAGNDRVPGKGPGSTPITTSTGACTYRSQRAARPSGGSRTRTSAQSYRLTGRGDGAGEFALTASARPTRDSTFARRCTIVTASCAAACRSRRRPGCLARATSRFTEPPRADD